jgi:MerR family Zn(II)-responsive transcriptional regulator of zntA
MTFMATNGNGQLMRIGKLAKKTGITTRTLRFYEEIGLISPTEHSHRGNRLYAQDCVDKIITINNLKEYGLKLSEIEVIFRAKDKAASKKDAVNTIKDILAEQEKALNFKIAFLTKMKEEMHNTMRVLDGCPTCRFEPLESYCQECIFYEGEIPITFKALVS